MSDAPNMIDVTIDDVQVSVPQGTLVIRAAEQAGIRIPRFCDHPLLAPVAACRQCLVEVGMPDRNTGQLRFMPKPQPRVHRPSPRAWSSRPSTPPRWWIAPSVASWSSCSSTTRWTAGCDKGARCPCRTRR